LGVVQEVGSGVDSVDEPEKCTSGETATKEGQEGGDENGGPNGNAATEVPAGAHVVVLRSLAC